jgi:hypothetical protein
VLYMTSYTRNAIVHNGTFDLSVRLISKPFTIDDLNRELRGSFGFVSRIDATRSAARPD